MDIPCRLHTLELGSGVVGGVNVVDGGRGGGAGHRVDLMLVLSELAFLFFGDVLRLERRSGS